MTKQIKLLVLTNNQILLSQIEEVGGDVGEPDCKLIKPYVVKEPQLDGLQRTLEPFLMGISNQDTYMIHSDKIMTLADPKPTLLEKYEDLIK